jgi:hypothetical protein
VPEFVVIDRDFIHIVHIDFCTCTGAPPPHEQLLEIGWWPATPDKPATAVTLNCLKLFHILNLFGRVTATDFYRSVEARSNADGLGGIDRAEDGSPMPVGGASSIFPYINH